jgi:transcriptional regulator with XRE-family HTH domain
MWDWENLYKIIANNIRNKRKQLHISQGQLAEKSGLSLDTIKSVEQGRRTMSLDTFLKIAEALKIAPQELINGAAFDVYLDRFTFSFILFCHFYDEAVDDIIYGRILT